MEWNVQCSHLYCKLTRPRPLEPSQCHTPVTLRTYISFTATRTDEKLSYGAISVTQFIFTLSCFTGAIHPKFPPKVRGLKLKFLKALSAVAPIKDGIISSVLARVPLFFHHLLENYTQCFISSFSPAWLPSPALRP